MRYLVEVGPRRGDWDPALPGRPDTFNSLNTSSGSPGEEAPPESLDGFFWSAPDGESLSFLIVMGIRKDRPGLSVVPLPTLPLAAAGEWAAMQVTAGGAGFPVLPARGRAGEPLRAGSRSRSREAGHAGLLVSGCLPGIGGGWGPGAGGGGGPQPSGLDSRRIVVREELMARESKKARRETGRAIFELLEKEYPEAMTALDHRDPFELAVATILSAQCTDERVNMVTPALFRAVSRSRRSGGGLPGGVGGVIHSTGFFRNKAKNLIGMAQALVENHGGELPRTLAELTKLPGIGRKTANVILGNAFGIDEGVVVDTHVKRLAGRMGFSREKTPEKIEMDLMEIFPRDRWTPLSHLLIFHGREVCPARTPRCEECVVAHLCPRLRCRISFGAGGRTDPLDQIIPDRQPQAISPAFSGGSLSQRARWRGQARERVKRPVPQHPNPWPPTGRPPQVSR